MSDASHKLVLDTAKIEDIEYLQLMVCIIISDTNSTSDSEINSHFERQLVLYDID